MKPVQLSQLVDMYSPEAVLEEVKNIFIGWYPVGEFGDVREVFGDFRRLYSGAYPGYCACSTRYHDEMHITDSFLAMARLLDGYNAVHAKMPLRPAKLGLISALLHDTGFIQSVRDRKGTGAKYTLTHVERSVSFIRAYFQGKHFGKDASRIAANALLATDLCVPVEKIRFRTRLEKIIGMMLGSADLLGQMASRCYLERLPFLYGEFREGRVPGYSSELELIVKTLRFSELMDRRLAVTLENVARYARFHFKRKYRVDRDLYRDSIRGQINYLKVKVLRSPRGYQKFLRRARKGKV